MKAIRSKEVMVDQIIAEQIKKWEMNKKKKSKPIRPVIALSRLPGCGANALAKQLAADLAIDLFDHEIVEAVAKSAHVSETIIATLDERDRSILDDWIRIIDEKHHLWSNEYLRHLTTVVCAIATHGNAIILGRGASYILPHEVCLRLLIVAPLDFRVNHVMNAHDVTAEVAKKQITKTEADRRAFIKNYFNAEMTDPVNYDLTINMTQYKVENAAKIVKAAFDTRSWYDYSMKKR